jgi:DNA-binding NarL/FixJ family response regulator
MDQGDLSAARSSAEEAVVSAHSSGRPWQLGHALMVLGEIASRQGDSPRALALQREALAVFEKHGDTWAVAAMTRILASSEDDRSDFKRLAALASVQLYRESGDDAALASSLEYLAGRSERGRAEECVALLAAAHALRQSLGSPLPAQEREDVERYLRESREQLGEARFTAAWAHGRALGVEQVVTAVLNQDLPTLVPKAETTGRSARAPDALTRRELQVARLLAQGLSDRQIAHELNITEGTAGVHVHRILEKLRLRSRVQVTEWAHSQGLIELHTH